MDKPVDSAENFSRGAPGGGAAEADGVGETFLSFPTGSPVFPGWGGDPVEEPGARGAPLAAEMRPRTRLRTAGAEALSSAELLAVLFAAFPGTGDAAAMELAGRFISERGDLHGLLRSSIHELMDRCHPERAHLPQPGKRP